MMIKTGLFRFFYLIALSATISGCTKPMVALNEVPAGQNHQTGGIDHSTGQPSTTAIEPELPSPNTTPEEIKEAKSFARDVIDFKLSRQDEPFVLNVLVSVPETKKTEVLEWKSVKTGSQLLNSVVSNNRGSAKLKCTENTCATREVELDFKEFKILLRESRQIAGYKFTGNFEVLSSMAPQSRKRLLEQNRVWVTTKEVSEGPSIASIFFEGSMCFSTGLIRTNQTDKPITFGCSIPKTKDLEAVLAGNTEVGQWFFRFSTPNQSPLFLEVTLPSFCSVNPTNSVCKKSDSAQSETGKDDKTEVGSNGTSGTGSGNQPQPGSPTPIKPPITTAPASPTSTQDVLALHPYFKLNFKNPITAQLNRSERFDTKGLIKQQLATWTNQEKFLWVEYYKNMGRRLHEVTPAFDRLGVPHEFIFVTFWETDYFKRPNYVISIGGDEEVGPWQFMYNTGKGSPVNLKVFPVLRTFKGKVHQSCDQRAHLMVSSIGAAKYFKYLLGLYPLNPELSVLAYNWGMGYVNKALSRCQNTNQSSCIKTVDQIKALDRAGFNFWTIAKYNMAPAVRIGYVVKLLSALQIAKKSSQLNLKFADSDMNYKDVELLKCTSKTLNTL